MFEVYTKKVTIETRMGPQEIEFRPLPGSYYPMFMEVVTKMMAEASPDMDADNIDVKEVVKMLDSQTVSKLHTLVLQSLLRVYKDVPKEQLEEFVSQNLFVLMDPLLEVNIGMDLKETPVAADKDVLITKLR